MRLVIFDFDGTLADTGKVILLTLSETLQHLGYDIPTEEELKSYIGMPLARIFKYACNTQDNKLITEAVRIYRSSFGENCRIGIDLYPGVRETLDRLSKDGKLLAIASSREKSSLLSLVDQLDIRSCFSVIAGEQDVTRHKPEPDVANYVLEQCGLQAGDAMFVGDTTFDIHTGRAAGIKTCGVSYGNHTRGQLLEAGADYVIDKFPELIRLVSEKS